MTLTICLWVPCHTNCLWSLSHGTWATSCPDTASSGALHRINIFLLTGFGTMPTNYPLTPCPHMLTSCAQPPSLYMAAWLWRTFTFPSRAARSQVLPGLATPPALPYCSGGASTLRLVAGGGGRQACCIAPLLRATRCSTPCSIFIIYATTRYRRALQA